jgi:mono/diheme cytochrome c family protein
VRTPTEVGRSTTYRYLLLALAVFMLDGCGSARRGEPLGVVPLLDTPQERRGQQVFMRHCTQCHNGGAGSLGPALNNKPLPNLLIRLQVRRGLGAMPAFPADKISDAQLDDLVAYLRALRHAGPSALGANG